VAPGALHDAGAKFDLQELYAAMKHPLTEPPAEPHAALKHRLMPYQLRAAKWMQCRGERSEMKKKKSLAQEPYIERSGPATICKLAARFSGSE
jgi:hypothetical protein